MIKLDCFRQEHSPPSPRHRVEGNLAPVPVPKEAASVATTILCLTHLPLNKKRLKVGKELFIEATADQLILRTLNDAKSAFAAFYFNDAGGFFESFRRENHTSALLQNLDKNKSCCAERIVHHATFVLDFPRASNHIGDAPKDRGVVCMWAGICQSLTVVVFFPVFFPVQRDRGEEA